MAIVEGKLETPSMEALFRASVDCSGTRPVGSIFGSFDAEFGEDDFKYIFKSDQATQVITSISGTQRSVSARFVNVTVTNITSSFTVFNGTITLEALRNSSGIITASLAIFRPGRVTLRASSRLQHGVIIVNQSVSCTS